MEAQLVPAEIDCLSAADDPDIVRDAVERGEHPRRLRVANERELRKNSQELPDRAGVVRLHVIDDEELGHPVPESLADGGEVGLEGNPLDRVDERGLSVNDGVGVVGDAARQGPEPLEEVGRPVVRPDVEDTPGDRDGWTHR